MGALLIGFVNFLVSFSVTLFLALQSRGGGFYLIPKVVAYVFRDFFKYPLHYFFSR